MAGRHVSICFVPSCIALGGRFGPNPDLEIPALSESFAVPAKVPEHDGPAALPQAEQGDGL